MNTHDKRICELANLQYKNLKESLNETLVYPILGRDYYNYYSDMQCDTMCCKDLKREFNKVKRDMRFWRAMAILNLVAVMFLLLIRP